MQRRDALADRSVFQRNYPVHTIKTQNRENFAYFGRFYFFSGKRMLHTIGAVLGGLVGDQISCTYLEERRGKDIFLSRIFLLAKPEQENAGQENIYEQLMGLVEWAIAGDFH
jgi:hypothetical protein